MDSATGQIPRSGRTYSFVNKCVDKTRVLSIQSTTSLLAVDNVLSNLHCAYAIIYALLFLPVTKYNSPVVQYVL